MVTSVFAVLFSSLMALRVGPAWMGLLRWPLCAYFTIQAVLASRLWKNLPPGWQVEVLLTSAEEASLVGSLAYVRAHAKALDKSRTFVVNFDGLGAGELRIVRSTGCITTSTYDSPLVHAAMETARLDSRFASVKPADWHVGDFESVNFLRRGYACLALSSVTKEGVMPNLHRPGDVLANVDSQVSALAVDFAEAAIRRFAVKA